MNEKTLFEQVAEELGAPIKAIHGRPLSEMAVIDTIPPIECRGIDWVGGGKVSVGVDWPHATLEMPKERKYSASRGAKTIARAIIRDVLTPNVGRYGEEVERLLAQQALARKRQDVAEKLAAFAATGEVREHGFNLPTMPGHEGYSGHAIVSGSATRVNLTLYSVPIEVAQRIILALKMK